MPTVLAAQIMAAGCIFIALASRRDYMSQPSGNAWERVACGVFEKLECLDITQNRPICETGQ